MNDQAKYERAKKHVEEIKGFYSHLFAYVSVNVALFAINMLTSREQLWFYWPLVFWGIGLVAHAITVFGSGRFFGHDWEQRKIREYMERGGRGEED
jgi:hypothetical protein